MMTLFLTYELKVAVLIAVFYIFWRLLVANETWHRLNRIVLLSTAIASFVLPLCVFTIHQTVLVDGGEWMVEGDYPETIAPSTLILPSSSNVATTGRPFNWLLLLTLVYIIGVIAVLSKMLLSLWRLHRIAAESEIHPLADGRRIAVSDKAKAPFSWWKTVFLNHHDYEEGATALLTHELGHIRLHHSADVILVELLTALQWFNPAMWMLRTDLRAIHEYQADQQVLSHGFNDIQYLNLLIRKAAVQGGYSLANGINNSTIKKRVTMIMKPRSNRNSMLKLLALVPIVGICLALNAKTVTEVVYKSDEPQKQVPVKKGRKNATIKTSSNQAIQVVEAPQSTDHTKPLAEGSYTAELQYTDPNVAVLILNTKQAGEEPLLILDGKIATIDQVRALPRDSVASASMMREEAAVKSYGENAKNGALIITTVKHQEEIDNEPIQPDVYIDVEEKPQFPGGGAAMIKYFSSNMPNLADAVEAGFQGRVIVSFIVEKDGSISNAKVTKPTYTPLDEEALRMVNAMPRWTPGKQNGEAVRVRYSIPIRFDLKGTVTTPIEGTAFPHIEGTATPHAEGNATLEEGHAALEETAEQLTRIDENGKIIINGKEVKRFLIDGSDNLAMSIMNILLNDIDHFDYEIDGEPVTAKELQERKSKDSIKSIEYVQRDSEHPKDRLLITTKKAE